MLNVECSEMAWNTGEHLLFYCLFIFVFIIKFIKMTFKTSPIHLVIKHLKWSTNCLNIYTNDSMPHMASHVVRFFSSFHY